MNRKLCRNCKHSKELYDMFICQCDRCVWYMKAFGPQASACYLFDEEGKKSIDLDELKLKILKKINSLGPIIKETTT